MIKSLVSNYEKKVTLLGKEFPYIVIYKRSNKYINIRYKKDHFEVSCPYLTSDRRIRDFFEEKELAIYKLTFNYDVDEFLQTLPGSIHYIVGEEYTMDYSSKEYIDGNVLYVHENDPKSSLIRLSSPILLGYINERMDYYYPLMYGDYNFPKVSLKTVKSYYGLCKFYERKIIINTAMAFAKKDLIDYVIVHELCHLKYHDHQSGFKSFLKSIMPDYEKRRKRLKNEVKL